MGRAPCCDKATVKRGPWSPEEDAQLKSYMEKHGTGGNWIALPQKIGLKRCGKSCRLRWLNYLRPNLKHGSFTEEEDRIICSLYISIGSRWSIIAAQLPGRTDNDIKNYWNTKLKKKLLGKPPRKPLPSGPNPDSTKTDTTQMILGSYWPELSAPAEPIQPPVPAGAFGLGATELDEIFQFSQVKLEGLDGLFDQEAGISSSSSSSTTSESWFNGAPSFHGGIMHQCLYEEPMHLAGTQY